MHGQMIYCMKSHENAASDCITLIKGIEYLLYFMEVVHSRVFNPSRSLSSTGIVVA